MSKMDFCKEEWQKKTQKTSLDHNGVFSKIK
jgi:hypothetical protein